MIIYAPATITTSISKVTTNPTTEPKNVRKNNNISVIIIRRFNRAISDFKAMQADKVANFIPPLEFLLRIVLKACTVEKPRGTFIKDKVSFALYNANLKTIFRMNTTAFQINIRNISIYLYPST